MPGSRHRSWCVFFASPTSDGCCLRSPVRTSATGGSRSRSACGPTSAAAATIESVGICLGPALGGVLLVVASPQAVFAVVAVILLLSAALVARISARPARPHGAAADTEERLTRQLLAGVRLLVVAPR